MDNQIILSADGQQSEKSVIIYRSEDGTIQLEVQLHEETVWLTQAQMAILFETTRNNITIHIGNLFREGELDKISVCKDSLLTASDGKPYKTKIYNLDVIISVGYRVKSKRGTDFRKWANKVIKDFILKGYAVNNRLDILEVKVYKLEEKTNAIDSEIHSQLPPHEGVFYNGQIFDAYNFIADLIRKAKKEIILIDNYVDDSVLKILNKREDNVSATIYTAHISGNLKLDLEKHNSQYQPINIEHFNKSHDRFLIIDDEVYHIGASLKDLGKKMFAFSKLNFNKEKILKIL
ncbi:MAG: virulence RhuM family protein [Bacteroidales bacterium]|nr:virulence RhuM family protein [Bacteroidales bacterium]